MNYKYNPISGNLELIGVDRLINPEFIPDIIVDHFYATNNQGIFPISSYVAGGGTITYNAEQFLRKNANGTDLRPTTGHMSLNLSGTDNTSRSVGRIGGGVSGLGIIQCYSTSTKDNIFYIDWESGLVNGNINPSLDMCFIHWGVTRWLEQYPSTLSSGFYIRPPRTNETNYMKYCIIQNGIETALDSTILWDTTSNAHYKVRVGFNNEINTIFYRIQDDTSTYNNTITISYASNPSLYNVALQITWGISRNNVASNPTKSIRTMNVDRMEIFKKNLFK